MCLITQKFLNFLPIENRPKLKVLTLGFYLGNYSKRNDSLIGCPYWNKIYLLFKQIYQLVTAIKINSIQFNLINITGRPLILVGKFAIFIRKLEIRNV